jgi:hypothetical protein
MRREDTVRELLRVPVEMAATTWGILRHGRYVAMVTTTLVLGVVIGLGMWTGYKLVAPLIGH